LSHAAAIAPIMIAQGGVKSDTAVCKIPVHIFKLGTEVSFLAVFVDIVPECEHEFPLVRLRVTFHLEANGTLAPAARASVANYSELERLRNNCDRCKEEYRDSTEHESEPFEDLQSSARGQDSKASEGASGLPR
jgi:hypothetical protein